VRFRANYAVVYVGAQLGPERRSLGLEWADEVGDETEPHEFEVPTADPHDPFVGLQAFDVGSFGHEIRINGESLSGFDIPPNDGWQYWVDTLSGAVLTEGTNTIQFCRDPDSTDAFAVGTVRVHWKEPVETTADTGEAVDESATQPDDSSVAETNTGMFDDDQR
jgi:hypothetical protein